MSRTRSHWGWGWSDRFPDAATRHALGQQLQGVLSIPVGEVREPVPLDEVTIAPPRIAAPTALAHLVTDDREARIRHTYGRAFPDLVRGFVGDFSAAPDLVAHPTSEDDVAAILAWATSAGVAVIPFGGGTSVVRGVEADVGDAYAGTLSLDMTRMDRLLAVDAESRLAHFQAGVLGPSLEDQLAPHGLTLRHFPQSFEHASLGGWIATRAGGHFATVHTHIDDFVAAVRVVTPTGVVQTRRLPASGAGPDPARLWMGSEGTLGVITEAWMRVRPKPRWRSKATVRFADWHEAIAATRRIAQSDLAPANCRLLDRREALLHGVSFDGVHLLLLGFESDTHPTEAWMAAALELAGGDCPKGAQHADRGTTPDDSGQAGAWKQAFFDGPYLQTALVGLGVITDTFETAVPWDHFHALHEHVVGAVRAAILSECGSKGFVSCRLTHVYPDGAAPYYTFVAPGGPDMISRWAHLKETATRAILEAGGTVTHHHAVGRLHRDGYEVERPRGFGDVLAAVKAEVDPDGILNPGVLLRSDQIRKRDPRP